MFVIIMFWHFSSRNMLFRRRWTAAAAAAGDWQRSEVPRGPGRSSGTVGIDMVDIWLIMVNHPEWLIMISVNNG